MKNKSNFPLAGAWLIFGLMLILLSACENGIVGTGAKGLAQKGPFEAGAEVSVVNRPGPDYQGLGATLLETQDSMGRFEFDFEADVIYEMSIYGRYFNEVTGELSAEPVSLKNTWFHGTSSPSFVSINILTHLIHRRVDYLVMTDKMSPSLATTKASEDLLVSIREDLFAGHLDEFNFTNMAVYNLENSDSNSNAVLLFISAAFIQQSSLYPNSSSLSAMLAAIAEDLEADGIINDNVQQQPSLTTNATLVSSLDFAARYLDPDQIELNLKAHSINTTGIALPIPDIRPLLDTDADNSTNDIDSDDDGDGISDDADDTPVKFGIIASDQTVNTTAGVDAVFNLQFNMPENTATNNVSLGVSTLPANGELRGTFPNRVYIPDEGFTGQDSFSYSVTCAVPCMAVPEGSAVSNTATVTINVVAG